jgi:xanthine dehydrogenase accessory factor
MTLIRGGLVVVRGAGDLATGTILRLTRAGFRVVALESERPSAIRRTVSLSEAVYEGCAQVEGVRAVRCDRVPEAWSPGDPVALLVDPGARCLGGIRPLALVDAILAKRNLGTRLDMAPVVVALGPGFTAGVAGHGADRVVHAPAAGRVELLCGIGDTVAAGQAVLAVGGVAAASEVAGTVRGLIREGFEARKGLKVADIDPRCVREHCFTVSDKALAVAGGVLEAILALAAP